MTITVEKARVLVASCLKPGIFGGTAVNDAALDVALEVYVDAVLAHEVESAEPLADWEAQLLAVRQEPLRVGDVVRSTTGTLLGNENSRTPIGSRGVVLSPPDCDGDIRVKFDGVPGTWFVRPDELEHVG